MRAQRVLYPALGALLAGAVLCLAQRDRPPEGHGAAKPHPGQHQDHSFADVDRFQEVFESPERAFYGRNRMS
jgi:hypothetical protein